MAKNSSPSRAPKNGAQLQTTWRSPKNVEKPQKTIPAPQPPYGEDMSMNCASRDIDHRFKCTATVGPTQFSDV